MKGKIFIVGFLLFILMGVTACGKEKDPYIFVNQKVEWNEGGTITDIDYYNEQLYVASANLSDKEEIINSYVNICIPEQSDDKKMSLQVKKNINLGQEGIDELVVRKQGMVVASLNGDGELSISLLNEDGKCTVKKNWKDICQDDANYIKLLANDDGVFLVSGKHIYFLNNLLEVTAVIEGTGEIEQAEFVNESSIIVTYAKKNDDVNQRALYQVLSCDNQTWMKEGYIPLKRGYAGIQLIYMEDSMVGIGNDEGLFSLTDDKVTTIFSYSDVFSNWGSMTSLVEAGKESFYSVDHSKREQGDIRFFSKIRQSEAPSKEKIVVGGLLFDDEVRNQVDDYNLYSEEYYVVLKDFYDEEIGYKASVDKFSLALMGNTEEKLDVVLISSVPLKQMLQYNLLCDLTQFLHADSRVREEDFIQSVYEAMKIDDKLFYVAPSFVVNCLVGKESIFGKKDRVDTDEVKELLERYKASLFPFDQKRASAQAYMPWLVGKSEIQGLEQPRSKEQIKEMLCICDSTADCQEGAGVQERLHKNYSIFFPHSGTLRDMCTQKQLFGEDIVFVDYLNTEGEGTYFSFRSMLGIMEKSEHKEAAWDFLAGFWTKDYQDKGLGYMPIRQDSFDWYVKKCMTKEKIVSESGEIGIPLGMQLKNGELVEKGPVSMYGAEVYESPITDSEWNEFEALLQRTHKVDYEQSDELSDIITEELSAYFEGKKNMEETVNVLYSRMELYMAE